MNFLWEQRYRRIKDQKPWPGVGTQLGTRLRTELKPIVKMRKCLNWEMCLSEEVHCTSFKSITDGGLGRSPQPLGNFS